ncbi:TPA: Dabb family protein [Escherichia coli]|nr:Dabb family protein [Escherichia coli]HEC6767214.1 Dabb family protein [Salmonella enterica subsp. enterica serovar Virchow]EHW3094680.1 Dabb family protein [Escherichia coli]EIR6774964.1 Dabb family protein [Escherichia coli]EIT7078365.1 Dabb family protein [Escherichia coli]
MRRQDCDTFLTHPEHEAIKNIFRPILNDIIVFDYDLTS